jgi:hypothetical protein
MLQISLACRFRQQPNWLGVSYRVHEDIVAIQPSEDSGVALKHAEANFECGMGGGEMGNTFATEHVPTSKVQFDGNVLRVTALDLPHTTTATTHQWAYCLPFTRPYWIE